MSLVIANILLVEDEENLHEAPKPQNPYMKRVLLISRHNSKVK